MPKSSETTKRPTTKRLAQIPSQTVQSFEELPKRGANLEVHHPQFFQKQPKA
jgi:hypothetical protein